MAKISKEVFDQMEKISNMIDTSSENWEDDLGAEFGLEFYQEDSNADDCIALKNDKFKVLLSFDENTINYENPSINGKLKSVEFAPVGQNFYEGLHKFEANATSNRSDVYQIIFHFREMDEQSTEYEDLAEKLHTTLNSFLTNKPTGKIKEFSVHMDGNGSSMKFQVHCASLRKKELIEKLRKELTVGITVSSLFKENHMNEIIQKAEVINAMIGKCSPDWEETTGMKFAEYEESQKPDIDGYVFLKDKNLKVKLGIACDTEGDEDLIDGYLKEAYFSIDGKEYLPYSHFSDEYAKRKLEEGELLKDGEKALKDQEKAKKKADKESEKELKALKKEYEVKADTDDINEDSEIKNTVTLKFGTYVPVTKAEMDKLGRDLQGAIVDSLIENHDPFFDPDCYSYTPAATATADVDDLPAPVAAEMFLDTDQFSDALKLVQNTQKSIKECHHSLLAIRGELDDVRKAKMDEILSALQGMEHSFLDKVSNPICGPMETAAPVELSVEKTMTIDPMSEAPMEEAPMEVMATTGTKEYTDFLNALRKMRWDEIKPEEAQEEWLTFFRSGNTEDFYLHTLDVMREAGEEAKKRYNRKPQIKKTESDYSDEEYQQLYAALKKLPASMLKSWAVEAYGKDGSKMSKNEIMDAYVDQNGQQAIDHMDGGGDVADLFSDD